MRGTITSRTSLSPSSKIEAIISFSSSSMIVSSSVTFRRKRKPSSLKKMLSAAAPAGAAACPTRRIKAVKGDSTQVRMRTDRARRKATRSSRPIAHARGSS